MERFSKITARLSRGWKEFRITDEHYCEGDVAQPFLYRGRRCLIALCGDLWDLPERFDCGEEILFWPVYVNFKQADWQDSVRASSHPAGSQNSL